MIPDGHFLASGEILDRAVQLPATLSVTGHCRVCTPITWVDTRVTRGCIMCSHSAPTRGCGAAHATCCVGLRVGLAVVHQHRVKLDWSQDCTVSAASVEVKTVRVAPTGTRVAL